MKDAVLEAADADLDTRIREAEARIVDADLQWKRHSDQLARRVRGRAGQIAWWGGMGAGAAVAGAVWLRWRSSKKAVGGTVAQVGRRQVPSAVRSGIGGLRAAVAHTSKATAGVAAPAIAPAAHSPAWHGAMSTLGTVLGSAARSGLSLPSKPGILPLLMGAGVPLLTRWLRSPGRPAR